MVPSCSCYSVIKNSSSTCSPIQKKSSVAELPVIGTGIRFSDNLQGPASLTRAVGRDKTSGKRYLGLHWSEICKASAAMETYNLFSKSTHSKINCLRPLWSLCIFHVSLKSQKMFPCNRCTGVNLAGGRDRQFSQLSGWLSPSGRQHLSACTWHLGFFSFKAPLYVCATVWRWTSV